MDRPSPKCTACVTDAIDLRSFGSFHIYFYAPADLLPAIGAYGMIRSWTSRKDMHALDLDLRYDPDEVVAYINALGEQPPCSRSDVESLMTGGVQSCTTTRAASP